MDNLVHWKSFVAKIFLLWKIIFKCSSQFWSTAWSPIAVLQAYPLWALSGSDFLKYSLNGSFSISTTSLHSLIIQSYLICADRLHKFKTALFTFLHTLIGLCNHLSVLFFYTFRCKYLYFAIKKWATPHWNCPYILKICDFWGFAPFQVHSHSCKIFKQSSRNHSHKNTTTRFSLIKRNSCNKNYYCSTSIYRQKWSFHKSSVCPFFIFKRNITWFPHPS